MASPNTPHHAVSSQGFFRKRNCTLLIRLTPQEKQIIERAAADCSNSIDRFVYNLVVCGSKHIVGGRRA